MILTIYNGSPPMLFFGISYYTVEKTHPRVTPDQQT